MSSLLLLCYCLDPDLLNPSCMVPGVDPSTRRQTFRVDDDYNHPSHHHAHIHMISDDDLYFHSGL